jgi:hypothetical protein
MGNVSLLINSIYSVANNILQMNSDSRGCTGKRREKTAVRAVAELERPFSATHGTQRSEILILGRTKGRKLGHESHKNGTSHRRFAHTTVILIFRRTALSVCF